MTLQTAYGKISVPESGDIADEPLVLQAIAQTVDDMWGGAFKTWNPVVTQGAGGAADTSTITLNTVTSVSKYKKVGRTVYVVGRFDITAGNGAVGIPVIFLPFPAVSVDECLGIAFSSRGGAFAINQFQVVYPGSTNFPTALDRIQPLGFNNTTRGLNDWLALHLCYETSVV